MDFALSRCGSRLAGGFFVLSLLMAPALAQAPAAPATPLAPATPIPAPTTPPSAVPPTTSDQASPPALDKPQGAPPAVAEPQQGAPGVPNDATAQPLTVPARPVAFLRGNANWEGAFKSIQGNLAKIKAEVEKAGLKQGGNPITVFVETDDNGFRYEAMIPLVDKPEGKTDLDNDVKLGSSPGGKALKFQHRGAYDEIDATYDLITAFLDEKGLEAQNLFIEEYLTPMKAADDNTLEVDIYVFLK